MVKDLLLSAAVSVGSVSAFGAFNPPIPQGTLEQMRAGYKSSVIASLVIGGAASLVSKDEYPLLAGLGATGLMILLYEMRIREVTVGVVVPSGGVAPVGTTPAVPCVSDDC
jgi:hypothetical protein